MLGLGLLSLVSEEFVRPDSPLPDVRKKELRASLVWAMPSILQVLAEVSRCTPSCFWALRRGRGK